uniref:Uncharacterized protein n=1 Tax=Anguilla anguilla TaxID=7936 RepID=A0A0E9RSK2_ANGAN
MYLLAINDETNQPRTTKKNKLCIKTVLNLLKKIPLPICVIVDQ